MQLSLHSNTFLELLSFYFKCRCYIQLFTVKPYTTALHNLPPHFTTFCHTQPPSTTQTILHMLQCYHTLQPSTACPTCYNIPRHITHILQPSITSHCNLLEHVTIYNPLQYAATQYSIPQYATLQFYKTCCTTLLYNMLSHSTILHNMLP